MCLCVLRVCVADGLIPLCAGAPQGDPGGRQRRSLRAPSSGVRQEEADSSEAPHAKDGRGVSTKQQSESVWEGGRGPKVPLIEAFVWAPAGWTTGRSAATPGRRRRGSVSSTSSSGSTRAP